jgi:hypothetical protein
MDTENIKILATAQALLMEAKTLLRYIETLDTIPARNAELYTLKLRNIIKDRLSDLEGTGFLHWLDLKAGEDLDIIGEGLGCPRLLPDVAYREWIKKRIGHA